MQVDALMEVAVASALAFLQPRRAHLHFLLKLLVTPALGLRGGHVKAIPEQHEELGFLFLGVLGFRLDLYWRFFNGGLDGLALEGLVGDFFLSHACFFK